MRQYTTFKFTVFNIKYLWIGFSLFCCISLDEVAVVAWYKLLRDWVERVFILLCFIFFARLTRFRERNVHYILEVVSLMSS